MLRASNAFLSSVVTEDMIGMVNTSFGGVGIVQLESVMNSTNAKNAFIDFMSPRLVLMTYVNIANMSNNYSTPLLNYLFSTISQEDRITISDMMKHTLKRVNLIDLKRGNLIDEKTPNCLLYTSPSPRD